MKKNFLFFFIANKDVIMALFTILDFNKLLDIIIGMRICSMKQKVINK